MRSHYEVLGILPNATLDQIKSAYRKRAMETHPDRAGNADAFKEVQMAYDALTNGARPTHNYVPPKRGHPAAARPKKLVRRDFTIHDAPPPKFDIWGQPLSKAAQEEWAKNNAGILHKETKRKEGFVDIWKYEGGGQPDIR